MFKSKIIDILKTFSQTELKEFKDFVKSPIHNKNKNVIKLYELVRKHAPEFNDRKLAKESVYPKLFPGKKYNDTVLRILISDLIRLSEEYISYKRLLKEPLEESILLIKELRERNLRPLFEKAFKEADVKLNLKALSSQNYFLGKMSLKRERVEYNIFNDMQKLNSEYLLKQGEYLISYFLISILNLSHDLHIHKDLYNANFEFNMVDSFFKNFKIDNYIEFLKANSFKYYYLIKIYYLMHMADIFPDEDFYYYDFKKELEVYFNNFSKSEKHAFYLKRESLIIQKIERGKREFYSELLELYKNLLIHKIYKDEYSSFMRIEMFRNILFAGLFLNEFTWTEKFINDYINELSEEHRKNMYHLSLAYLFFYKKEFEKALENIIKVSYQLFVLKADVKVLTLKIYFELKEYESAVSALDSFNKFVVNNKNISELFKTRYLEFIKFYKKLISITGSNPQKEKIADLQDDILRSTEVLSKKWLMEKVSELTH